MSQLPRPTLGKRDTSTRHGHVPTELIIHMVNPCFGLLFGRLLCNSRCFWVSVREQGETAASLRETDLTLQLICESEQIYGRVYSGGNVYRKVRYDLVILYIGNTRRITKCRAPNIPPYRQASCRQRQLTRKSPLRPVAPAFCRCRLRRQRQQQLARVNPPLDV